MTRRLRSLWLRMMWPVLAGVVAAVGVTAAALALGWVLFLATFTTLSLFAVAMVWGLSLDLGIDRSMVLKISLYSGLWVMVLVGLTEIQPHAGLLLGALVGMTSPAAARLFARVRPRRATRRTRRPAHGVLMDKAMVDHRFEEIVHDLTESGDFPEP
jgi:hypothetical protein